MKRVVGILLTLTLIITMIGCSKSDNPSDGNITYKDLPSSSNLEIFNGDEFTHDDATTIFENNREINNYDINDYEILDSILVDDKSTQIKAIILFDDKKVSNSCNLAFIVENMDKENVVQEITFAVNEVEGVRDFEIYDGGHLIYKENGAVTLPIREIKTNEVFDITITYSHQEPDETKFKIISNKHGE